MSEPSMNLSKKSSLGLLNIPLKKNWFHISEKNKENFIYSLLILVFLIASVSILFSLWNIFVVAGLILGLCALVAISGLFIYVLACTPFKSSIQKDLLNFYGVLKKDFKPGDLLAEVVLKE